MNRIRGRWPYVYSVCQEGWLLENADLDAIGGFDGHAEVTVGLVDDEFDVVSDEDPLTCDTAMNEVPLWKY